MDRQTARGRCVSSVHETSHTPLPESAAVVIIIIYTYKIGDVTHLHIKWQAWLNAIG